MGYRNFANEKSQRAGQVQNNAGGYAFEIDQWKRLQRFLVLGTEGGTYYQSEMAVTEENYDSLLLCLKDDGRKAVDQIVGISQAGRAVKNSPAIFALAIASAEKFNPYAHEYALASLPLVCRTASDLFEYISYVTKFRGWGSALKRAVAEWYTSKDTDRLQYQMVKYQNRHGWSHRDVLRQAHPKTIVGKMNNMFLWATKPEDEKLDLEGLDLISAFEWVKETDSAERVVDLINDFKLPWEAIPSKWHRNADVRMALLRSMPLTALIRQLGIYTNLELLTMKSEGEALIREALHNEDILRKARVHPFVILKALQQYAQGRGDKGSLTWRPNPRILEWLEDAFYLSYGNVEPSNAKILLGIDVSGSMTSSLVAGLNNMRSSVAAAAQALVLVNVEPYVDTIAYDTSAYAVQYNKRFSIGDSVLNVGGGGTNCSIPVLWATQNKQHYDVVINITDNETWYDNNNPSWAMKEYRDHVNPEAKQVIVAMTATGLSIGSPEDRRNLDIVGLDANVPQLITEFIKGNV